MTVPSNTSSQVKASGHINAVFGLIQLPNKKLSSCSKDRSIKIWCPYSVLSNTLYGHLRAVVSLATDQSNYDDDVISLAILNVSSSEFILSGSADQTTMIWHSTYPYNLMHTLNSHTNKVNALSILNINTTQYIVSASDDLKIKIWETKSFSSFLTLNGHTSYVKALTILLSYCERL